MGSTHRYRMTEWPNALIMSAPVTLQQPQGLLRDDCLHQPCYCEENVFNLIPRVAQATGCQLSDLYAVLISNPGKTIPIWQQRAGSPSEDPLQDGLVIWDYHVILLQSTPAGVHVWDLDTRLPAFPCTAQQYAQEALKHSFMKRMLRTGGVRPELARFYRVVPGILYLSHFASDRRHMKKPRAGSNNGTCISSGGSSDGTQDGGEAEAQQCLRDSTAAPDDAQVGHQQVQWLAPPPPWPPIVASATGVRHNLDQYWDMGPEHCRSRGSLHSPGCPPQQARHEAGGPGEPTAGVEPGRVTEDAWLGCVYAEDEFVSHVLRLDELGL